MKLIDKDALVAEIKRLLAFYSKEIEDNKEEPWAMDIAKRDILQEILSLINTLEVKEVDLEKEKVENNNPKITIGTKIRLKMNSDVILSIISDDCHEDKFECSNGSVLSLKQIEKYYDII